MTHHDTNLDPAAIEARVRAWMGRHTGACLPDHVPYYLGIARYPIVLNGHTQWRTTRLRLLGIDDPGLERLMLLEAFSDNMAERHPATPIPGLFLA